MKRVAVITDISGLGNCSGSANTAIISALGVEVCLIPTAILSAQTGFGDVFIKVSENLSEYLDSLKKINPHFDVIYIGFIPNGEICDAASEFISHFGESKILVDPISADGGKRFSFLNDDTYKKIAKLAFSADVITPNLSELCLLANGNFENIVSKPEDEQFSEIFGLCQKVMLSKKKTVVVTGIDLGDSIATLTADNSGYTITKNTKIGGSFSGTGDIFASVICASLANNGDIHTASQKAGDFIELVMRESLHQLPNRNYGIPYQKYLSSFS